MVPDALQVELVTFFRKEQGGFRIDIEKALAGWIEDEVLDIPIDMVHERRTEQVR